ncbi:MAG: glyoxalase [Proteobacteria bacterium]|nr:MAG: glyoxalase [Pseudomonadota bacterium]
MRLPRRPFAAMTLRRALGLALALLVALAGAARADAVGAIGLTVSDLDAAVRFYTEVLDFEPRGEPMELAGAAVARLQGVPGARVRVARLGLGEETLELTEYLAPRGRAFPPDSRANDRWFQHVAIAVRDMDRAWARLRAHRVRPASAGPQRLPDWNPAAAGIEAFYFRDPDGHFLELIEFPPDKGDPRWRAPARRLFLGIDHTAIVVADTETSLAFYRDALGLRVAGASENSGPEQERLNAVAGARLRITTLRAARGPGIELLEYLAPRDGRTRPADARANDLLHWQTDFATPDVDAAAARVRAHGGRWISPGPVALEGAALGFARGLVVADPDGHALRLRAPR